MEGLGVAVTGASGLLGRAVMAALGERSVAVPRDALDRMRGADAVFHLAARTVVADAIADPAGTYADNVALTWRVLAVARDAGVRRVVVASSDTVYGARAPVPVSEQAPLAPDGPYAASKAAADVLAREWSGPPEVVVVRLANVYGPGDRHESRLVPGAITAALAGRAPVIRGDGTDRRDLLYVDDAARALLAAAEHGRAGEAYNAGTGTSHAVREVVDLVCELAGGAPRPVILGEERPGEGGRRAVDAAKLRAVSGWEPRVGLREGLERTITAARAVLD